MNPGAYLIKDNFFSTQELETIAHLATGLSNQKVSVHAAGKYKTLQWYQVALNGQGHSFVDKIYSFLGADSDGLCVFYYLAPGAVLHPHRDLTGASSNARIRFHVPVITNEDVFFNVSKKRVPLAPGQLWALDTSYLHSVENKSQVTRVHIVIECDINEKVRSHLIPKTFSSRVHDAFYVSILAMAFLKSLLLNSWRDPSYFVGQMRMVWNFIGWRFLGRTRDDPCDPRRDVTKV